MSKLTLEQRIGDALKDDITAAEIANLLVEVENALADAEQNAAATRKAAIDPIASPDPNKARALVEMSAFSLDRLKAALSRLQARYAERDAKEYAARWDADYAATLSKRDKLAAEYKQLYPKLESQIVDLLNRIAACDRDVSGINGRAPTGEHRRIANVELHARGRDAPSIAKTLQLPAWDSANLAWPPKPQFAAAMFAPLPHDPRFSADWASAHSGGAGADQKEPSPIQREQQRIAGYYKEETLLQDERRHREDVADRAAKRSA